jgi:hypothetical protein
MDNSRIPLGHLYSPGLEPTPDKGIGVLDILNVIQNKDQIIAEKQNNAILEVLNGAYKAKYLPEYQRLAQQSSNALIQTGKDILKEQAKLGGANKYNFKGDAAIKMFQAREKLNSDLLGLEQLGKNSEDATKRMLQALEDGTITPEEVAAAKKVHDESITTAKDVGEVKQLMPLYLEYITKKENAKRAENQRKLFEETEKVYAPGVTALSGRGYENITPSAALEFINQNYTPGSDQWNYLKTQIQRQKMFPPNTTDDDVRMFFAENMAQRAKKKTINPISIFNLNAKQETESDWNFDRTDQGVALTPKKELTRTIQFKDGTAKETKILEGETDDMTGITTWQIQTNDGTHGRTVWSPVKTVTDEEEPSLTRFSPKRRPELSKKKIVEKGIKGKIYIGANGKEYLESDFKGMDIQKLIKDKKIKPK